MSFILITDLRLISYKIDGDEMKVMESEKMEPQIPAHISGSADGSTIYLTREGIISLHLISL